MNSCEICGKERILETHHIKSRNKGGRDVESNRVKLCSNCHKLVHYGLIIIEGRFQCTTGNRPVWRKLGEESITGMKDPEVYIIPNTQHIRDNYLRS